MGIAQIAEFSITKNDKSKFVIPIIMVPRELLMIFFLI
jgi:hypothetical protein